jgi:hypothetical protein
MYGGNQMTEELLETIVKKQLLETEDHQCAHWESIQVLWMIYNNYSWRAPYLGVQGFRVPDIEQLELEKDFTNYLDLSTYGEPDDYDVPTWERLAIWLRDVVFNKDKLDLSIHSMTVWNYGDEGGPGLVIALLDKENNDKIFNSSTFWEEMTGENFPHKISRGLGLERTDKVYFIFTFVM